MYISDSNSVHSVSTDSEQSLSPSPRNSASVSDTNLQDITKQLGEIQADLINSSIVSTVNSNSDDESGNGSDQSFDTGSDKGEDQHLKQNSNADLDLERVIEQLEQTRAEYPYKMQTIRMNIFDTN